LPVSAILLIDISFLSFVVVVKSVRLSHSQGSRF
jgi:hypothetical protein